MCTTTFIYHYNANESCMTDMKKTITDSNKREFKNGLTYIIGMNIIK